MSLEKSPLIVELLKEPLIVSNTVDEKSVDLYFETNEYLSVQTMMARRRKALMEMAEAIISRLIKASEETIPESILIEDLFADVVREYGISGKIAVSKFIKIKLKKLQMKIVHRKKAGKKALLLRPASIRFDEPT